MRRVMLAAPMLVAVLVACDRDSPAAPRVRPRIVVLPLGGAATVNATATPLSGIAGYTGHIAKGINASGKPVGTAFGGSPPSRAESFSPAAEVYFNINNPPQSTDGFAEEAFSVTDAGLITGFGVLDSHFRTYAVGGNWLPLLTNGVNQFGGYANNAGEVVGQTFFDVNNNPPGHPTLWTPNGGGAYAATDLGLASNASTEPRGISRGLSGSSRIIVGRRAGAQGGFTAVIWQNGSWSDLPGAEGCARNETQATGVSDAGLVVGLEGLCIGGPVLWSNGQLQSLLPECQLAFGSDAGGGEARRVTVTTGGRLLIVGTCIDQPAVWYDDGQGGYICELLPLLDGDEFGDAYDVNPSGQIVGGTANSQGGLHAVLWTFTIPGSGSRPPNAVHGGSYIGAEGIPVDFDGSASSDPDNDPLTYDWDFGDGSPHGTGAKPSHTYADNGTYAVTLTVNDGTGNTDAASTSALIGNQQPQVNAGSASTLQSGDVLAFSGSFSDPGTVDAPWATSISWGDGSTATTGSQNTQGAVNASHTYFATGSLTLELSVTDKNSGLGSASRTVTVNPRNASLVISPNPISLGSRKAMQLDVTVLSAPGFDATLINPASIRLGNGTDPDAALPQKKNGGYTVTLRDTNRDGLRDLTVSFDKSDPNLGLVTPSTSLVLRAQAPSTGGTIVIRSATTVNVTP